MAKRARRKMKASQKANMPPPPPPTFLETNGRAILATVVVVLIVVVAAYAVVNSSWGDGGEETPPTREKAAHFVLTDIDGAPVDLEAYRGKVVVLDLMATWCGPCGEQMDDLNNVRARYARSEVVLLSIDVTPDRDTVEQLRDFKNEHYASWSFAMDTDKVAENYGTGNIPHLVIIDTEGYIAWEHSGVTDTDTLVSKIDPLL